MPVRDPNQSSAPAVPKADYEKDLLSQATMYLNNKAKEKSLKATLDAGNKKIKELMEKVKMKPFGKHRQIILTLPDNTTRILVRDQVAESPRMVDNILDLVREKAGARADEFIVEVPQLAPGALEKLLSEGLVDSATLQEWLPVKETHSLIVREAKPDDE